LHAFIKAYVFVLGFWFTGVRHIHLTDLRVSTNNYTLPKIIFPSVLGIT